MPDILLTPTNQLKKRHASERRFKIYGRVAIGTSVAFLLFMVLAICSRGLGAFTQTKIKLDIHFSQEIFNGQTQINARPVIKNALKDIFPQALSRRDRRPVSKLISAGAPFMIAKIATTNPDFIGTTQPVWVNASSDVDLYFKGKIDTNLPEDLRKIKVQDIKRIEALQADGRIRKKFNTDFFTNGDSRDAEMAGILGAALGSFYSIAVCFIIAFPLGVLTAVYLEECAAKNWFTDLIEVNINNLAAVPSIVFGLLGLSIFLGVFNLPRSTPLVGGMVLALMTLPTIIIASRASLRSVPQSIRDAALGLGASKTQTSFHHVVPMAAPGILTGTILGMAQALGETAPLLMIGMVAFIVDLPQGVTDVATSLPVQIFLWADSPEKGFVERTSAAIIVLLVFLIIMNISAIILRKRFELRAV